MQNEFEKQVQQKMEELKLVPSDPVWQKVEMQIRRKKDRRRLIFWLPVLGLLLAGGGFWITLNNNHEPSSFNKTDNPVDKQTPSVTNRPVINEARITTNATTKINSKIRPDHKPVNKTFSQRGLTAPFIASLPEKRFLSKNSSQKEKLRVEQKAEINTKETTASTGYNPDRISEPANQDINPVDSNLIISEADDTSAVVKHEEKKEEPVAKNTDSVKTGSSSATPVEKKHAQAKWKYKIAMNAGVSGLGRINFFNGQKSFDVNYAPPPLGGTSGGSSGAVSTNPSPVQKSFSFSIGGRATKELGKRTSFSTGLQYNYYSNTIHVGNKIVQSAVFLDYRVSQYYANQSSSSAVTTLQPYRNGYHFIALPAEIDWQLLRKHPLNFYAGLSLQYLAHTNALIFDYSKQVYFHNDRAFNHTQLFSTMGFSYSVPVKKTGIDIGPQLQYAFSRLEKGSSGHHLFSYGLKVQLQLNKN